jgi:hypothetical protein
MERDRTVSWTEEDALRPWLELSRDMQLSAVNLAAQMARSQLDQMARMSEQWLDLWKAQIDFASRVAENKTAADGSGPYQAMLESMRGAFEHWAAAWPEVQPSAAPPTRVSRAAAEPSAKPAANRSSAA